jgi:HK97 family phage portal protein
VELIANTVCAMPLQATLAGNPARLPEWLRKPDGGFPTQRDLVEHLVVSQALHGAAYLWAEPAGDSWKLWPVDPGTVYVDSYRRQTDFRAWHEYRVNGEVTPLAQWFSTRPSRAGLVVVNHRTLPGVAAGVGPLQAARHALGGFLATDAYGGDVFGNGVPQGILSTDQDITADTAARYQDRWMDTADARIRVLGAGLQFQALRLNPKDAAWLEARQYNAAEIARIFLVPASRLGLPTGDSLTYATARDNESFMLRQCAAGYTGPVEAALDRLTPPGRGADDELRIRFDWDAYLRPTTQDKAQLTIDLLAAGVLDVSEARRIMGLTPQEGTA